MPAPKPPAFETLSLHAGQRPDPVTGARAVPIYQTTSYVFQDSDHAAALFNLERAGHIYTRISNPTTAVLEERLAALEAGVGAICTASGMAAMHLAIATLLSNGDHIVASSSLYGGTINLLAHTLPRFGITTTFVKPRALDDFRAAIKPNTRLVIGETIGNPGLEVLDIPAVAQIAKTRRSIEVSIVVELLKSCTDQPLPAPLGPLSETVTWRCWPFWDPLVPRSAPPPITRFPPGQGTVFTSLNPRGLPLFSMKTSLKVWLTTS